MKHMYRFFVMLVISGAMQMLNAQTIHEYYYNVNGGLPTGYDHPGNIVYPTGYTTYATYTPVVFVHGITGKLSGSYEANIEAVKARHLKAAFVQLDPTGTPEDNGKLLKRMIDRITSHYGTPTVSIVAHSKGGMDTERALYGESPYVSGRPSFGYEKVDAVYTFGSPLRGSRVADVGSALSWTGIAWIAMWYLNGNELTSASVQQFHNWAKHWRIRSNGTFRNYYHPNGASYTRMNMTEDNTTRWWAHQADDPCYENKWYFCTVGNAFHHSAGAYYDAHWSWRHGWQNWHSENDGFIAVYRAKRSVITNASPALTPGAGDYNYLTSHDANHTSLWDPGQGHFDREAAGYLHRGLYALARPGQDAPLIKPEGSTGTDVTRNPLYLSNGYITASMSGRTDIIVENSPSDYLITVWAAQPVKNISLVRNGQKRSLTATRSEYNELMHAYENVFELQNAEKGVWHLDAGQPETVVMAYNRRPETGFAVKWNMDEATGYTGNPIEVEAVNRDNAYGNLHVFAMITDLDAKKQQVHFQMLERTGEGRYVWRPENLSPGHKYAVAILARADRGPHLLQRSVYTTFYVPENLPVRTVETAREVPGEKSELGYEPSVYPNPVKDVLMVQSDMPSFEIIITDLAGKEVMRRRGMEFRWSGKLSGLKPGVYQIGIETSEGVKTRKLIVK